MRLSGPSAAAQWASRLWLLAAAGSALLPPETRLGWWLPLHLALAGAAGTAIAGAMPRFASSLAGARDRPDSWAAPALITVGTAGIALGQTLTQSWLLVTGGVAYGLAGALLAFLVVRAWRQGSNRRHAPILTLYLVAALAVVVGATFGALLGTGAAGGAFGPLRQAHIALNLWGFLGLTIAGSLVILVPVVLRIRAPDRRPWDIAVGLAGGLVVLATGLATGLRLVAVVGALGYALGTAALAVRTWETVRPGPRMPERTAGLHLGAAIVWLVGAAVAGLAALALDRLNAYQLALVAAVALGVAVQSLVGTWSYLLPVSAPGGAEARRRGLARTATAWLAQVAMFNGGTLLVVGAAARLLPGPVGTVGLVVVAVTGIFSLVKLPGPGQRTLEDPTSLD
jgi:nitrite reductase (NO-forming)